MRETKFRAWDKQVGMSQVFNVWEAKDLLRGLLTSYVVNEIPILMQYTGLKDKNGKEIYEGDIVRVLDRDWTDMEKDTKTLIVYFDKGEFLLISKVGITERESENPNQYNKDWIEAKIWRGYGRDRFEVVGSVYENPDLLN